MDLYLPILLCSSIVDQYRPDGDPSIRMKMITLSKNIISDKYLFDISENKTAKYLTVLDRLDDHLTPLWSEGNKVAYNTDAVLDFFQVQDEFIDDELRKSQLSRMLRTLDIEIRVYNSEGKSAKLYIIDRVNLSDLMKRYC